MINAYTYYGNYGYGYSSSYTGQIVFLVIAIMIAIAAAVLAFIFIMPGKKRKSLPPFGKFAHDFLNFKWLLTDKVLKFMYIVETVFVVLYSFDIMFTGSFGIGLLVLLLGPVAVRLIYELLSMFVILVTNSSEINNKLEYKDGKDHNVDFKTQYGFGNKPKRTNYMPPAGGFQQPRQSQQFRQQPQQGNRFCVQCGQPLPPGTNVCPKCGRPC